MGIPRSGVGDILTGLVSKPALLPGAEAYNGSVGLLGTSIAKKKTSSLL